MRRGRGAAGILQNRERQERLHQAGEEMEAERVARAKEHLEKFKSQLVSFVSNHKGEIMKSSALRSQFLKMCSILGVDPLNAPKKNSFWSSLVPGLDSFYAHLTVQVLTFCLASRSENGGLLEMRTLIRRLNDSRQKQGKGDLEVEEGDVRRAIEEASCLGEGGLSIARLNGQPYVLSLPDELNQDQVLLLSEAAKPFSAPPSSPPSVVLLEGQVGILDPLSLRNALGWTQERVELSLASLLREGILWEDRVEGPEGKIWLYWVFGVALG